MTDISCKGAGSWSAIEKNGFRTFCAIFFFFLKNCRLNQIWTKRGGKRLHPLIIKCLNVFNSSCFC